MDAPKVPATRRTGGAFRVMLLGVPISLLALFGCGGGGETADATATAPTATIGTTPPQVSLREVRVAIDGAPYRVYTDFTRPLTIDAAGIHVANTRISLEVVLDGDVPSVACAIGGVDLARNVAGRLEAQIQPAYLSETLDLACPSRGQASVRQAVVLKASDPQLDAALAQYLFEDIRRRDASRPGDPYSGFRVDSYYLEMQRLILAADVYADPESSHIVRHSPEWQSIESYLINVSEAFFEPCVGYDFDRGPARQCRSPAKVDKYYRWRTPLETGAELRAAHAMAEWRAAAGIAQAIKVVLLEHAADATGGCPASDEPAKIAGASLVCRALNVRRLLYLEVWRKWSDLAWVDRLGLGHDSTTQGTDVSHWIANLEFVVDMFHATAHIGAGPACVECAQLQSVPSRMDDLLDYFYEFGEGYVAVSCRPPHWKSGCDFHGQEFQVAKASDLGHLSSVIQLVSMYGQDRVCTTDRRKCVAMEALARTMDELAWAAASPADLAGLGFPKFDVFFNGYCRSAVADRRNPLYGFCVTDWATETGPSRQHRNLFGFANLGRYDRDLMIKLRRAADENQDGLLDGSDRHHWQFLVSLHRAAAGSGK